MSAPENDNDLIDRYLSLVPADEPQEVTAARVGLKRPRMTKIVQARRENEDVRVHPSTARRIEEVVAGLEDEDPVHRARMEGMRAAAEIMEAALDQVWEVVGEIKSPSSPAVIADRSRQAARSVSANGPRGGERGRHPEERDAG